VEDDRVFPSDLNRIENRVAERIVELLAAVPRLKPRDVTGLEAIELRLGITFHPLQIECLKGLAQANVLVLTGGPGTGKTTVLRGLIEVIEARALDYVLAAPTGRAAKRVTESTGRPSRTIHRLLGFTPGTRRFEHGRHNPLPCDAVIVDEVSMVDVRLMSRLLDAIRPGTLLVLVGDRDQLPSIGPGAVLQDLISSEAVPVFRLKHVFRQEGGSLIVSNAHRIREGRGLILPSDPESAGTTEDFYVLFREDPVQIARTTVDLVVERLPRSMGFDPIRDIQVLVPMYRGPAGIDQLNEDLSAALNPHGRVVSQRTSPLKIGDKVIQSTNDYEKEIYNGDIGTILEMDSRSGKVIVEFEGRPVAFTVAQLPSLSLAYAISVHKSQGSEYPCVVLPLHTQHFLLLKRNLLYTAVSRARKLLVVVGSSRALEIAIHEVGDATRFTRLAERLRQKQRS